MIRFLMGEYVLLLSYDPCDIFRYYNVESMHGLSMEECQKYVNNTEQAYIAGWCNFVPKADGVYENGDPTYVFINLSRCGTDIETFGLIMHELMHQSFNMHTDEEEIITWAEEESYKVYELVKPLLDKSQRK